MNIKGLIPTLVIADEGKTKSHKRDKSLNTPAFNKKAKTRRAKAKHDAKGRKTNRGK